MRRKTTAPPLSPSDALKARVLAVKARLKQQGQSYMKIATKAIPALDTAAGGGRITNIWNLRGTSEEVTRAWEQAADNWDQGIRPMNTPDDDDDNHQDDQDAMPSHYQLGLEIAA